MHGLEHKFGFVLVMTLCLVAMGSVCLLLLQARFLLYGKLIKQRPHQLTNLIQMEALAKQLFDNVNCQAETPCCYIYREPNQVTQDLKQEYCERQVEAQIFRYVLHDIGDYPCVLTKHKGKHLSTHHWFVTLQSSEERQMLQIRLAKKLASNQCGRAMEQEIDLKVPLSWRIFMG